METTKTTSGTIEQYTLEEFTDNFPEKITKASSKTIETVGPKCTADEDKLKVLPDRDLYSLAQLYGSNAREWSRKFASLLPEIENRRLYRKYRFHSIYEFAAKLAGMSNKTVDEVLRTYKKVENKPMLRAQIEEFGWGKVRAVTPLIENVEEKNLAYMVKNIPKKVLEEAVKQIKTQNSATCPFPPGWKRDKTEEILQNNTCRITGELELESTEGKLQNDTCGKARELRGEARGLTGESQEETHGERTYANISFRIDDQTEFRLRLYQLKLQKKRKEMVSFGETLKDLLDKAELDKQ